MCGSLRHENVAKKIGSPITIEAQNKLFVGVWDGHAREETLDSWLSQGWVEARTRDITHYTEGYREKQKEFSVPEGKQIKVIYHPKLQRSGKPPVKIVTRDAQPGLELNTHPRFPRLI